MKFTYKNLAIVAAYLVLADHVIRDSLFLDEGCCLLATNADSFRLCNKNPDQLGAHLYFDINYGCFVRSGKVTGRGFKVCIKEHEACAKAKKSISNFYFVHPSKTTHQSKNRDKQGLYKLLVAVVAVGFDPSILEFDKLAIDLNGGGITLLTKDEKNKIKSS